MIQKYEFNDTTQLSPHFNAKEFRCKCGNGNVDLDICYKDFPTIIKGKGLNGWGNAPVPVQVADAPKTESTVTATIRIGNDTYKGTFVKE